MLSMTGDCLWHVIKNNQSQIIDHKVTGECPLKTVRYVTMCHMVVTCSLWETSPLPVKEDVRESLLHGLFSTVGNHLPYTAPGDHWFSQHVDC